MKKQILLAAAALLIFSCNQNDLASDIVSKGDYENGFFITNQGNGSTSGTLDFVSSDWSNVVTSAYKTQNNEDLGILPKSTFTYGNSLYIIVAGANRIVQVDRYTLAKTFDRTDAAGGELNNPQYMTVYNGLGYISIVGNPETSADDKVLVIDLTTLKTVASIPVSGGPSKLFVSNGLVYVLLKGEFSQSGADQSNKIAVIDPKTNTVTKELTVGYGPTDFTGYSGGILITCQGHRSNRVNDSDGSIWTLDGSGNVKKTYDWASVTPNVFERVTNIGVNSDGFLYYLVDGKLNAVAVGSDPTQGTAIGSASYTSLNVFGNVAVAINAGDGTTYGTADMVNSKKVQKTITTGISPVFAGQ